MYQSILNESVTCSTIFKFLQNKDLKTFGSINKLSNELYNIKITIPLKNDICTLLNNIIKSVKDQYKDMYLNLLDNIKKSSSVKQINTIMSLHFKELTSLLYQDDFNKYNKIITNLIVPIIGLLKDSQVNVDKEYCVELNKIYEIYIGQTELYTSVLSQYVLIVVYFYLMVSDLMITLNLGIIPTINSVGIFKFTVGVFCAIYLLQEISKTTMYLMVRIFKLHKKHLNLKMIMWVNYLSIVLDYYLSIHNAPNFQVYKLRYLGYKYQNFIYNLAVYK